MTKLIRTANVTLLLLVTFCATLAQQRRIVIAAGTLLDGRGQVLKNTRIVIEGSKIVAIDPKAGPVNYDLRGFTVLPGWIDAHVQRRCCLQARRACF